jgi:RNA polymerase sigma-70 factor (ECF subfamily)
MTDSLTTRLTLIERLRDLSDQAAWSQFVQVYSPLVFRYARRRGLQDADAADVTQDVLRTVARRMGAFEYDRSRGTFRGWLLAVARSRIADLVESRRRAGAASGGDTAQWLLESLPESDEESYWEREHRQCLFDWACSRARGDFQEATWNAFWQTSVEGRAPQEAAQSLGMSVGAVYIARSRVLARLKELIAEAS